MIRIALVLFFGLLFFGCAAPGVEKSVQGSNDLILKSPRGCDRYTEFAQNCFPDRTRCSLLSSAGNISPTECRNIFNETYRNASSCIAGRPDRFTKKLNAELKKAKRREKRSIRKELKGMPACHADIVEQYDAWKVRQIAPTNNRTAPVAIDWPGIFSRSQWRVDVGSFYCNPISNSCSLAKSKRCFYTFSVEQKSDLTNGYLMKLRPQGDGNCTGWASLPSLSSFEFRWSKLDPEEAQFLITLSDTFLGGKRLDLIQSNPYKFEYSDINNSKLELTVTQIN